MDAYYQTDPNQGRRRILVIVGLVVLGVVIAAGAIVKWRNNNQNAAEEGIVYERTVDPIKNREQIPAGFPTALIVGAMPEVTFANDDRLNGRVASEVTYETTTPASDLYRIYLEYFGETGWEIVNTFNQTPIFVIVEKRGQESVTVSIEQNEGVSKVLTAYLRAPLE